VTGFPARSFAAKRRSRTMLPLPMLPRSHSDSVSTALLADDKPPLVLVNTKSFHLGKIKINASKKRLFWDNILIYHRNRQMDAMLIQRWVQVRHMQKMTHVLDALSARSADSIRSSTCAVSIPRSEVTTVSTRTLPRGHTCAMLLCGCRWRRQRRQPHAQCLSASSQCCPRRMAGKTPA